MTARSHLRARIAGQDVSLGSRALGTEDVVVRTPSALQGSTTSLGFAPALVFLIVAGFLHALLGIHEILHIRLSQPILYANTIANTWLLGGLAAAYGVWILGITRGWVTPATGGGFAIAGAGLILRIVVELPQVINQIPLAAMRPPEPYGTVLPLARGFGIVAFAFGLACVAAAWLSEWHFRRSGPGWTLPR